MLILFVLKDVSSSEMKGGSYLEGFMKGELLNHNCELQWQDWTGILICSRSKVLLLVETYLALSWIPMKSAEAPHVYSF